MARHATPRLPTSTSPALLFYSARSCHRHVRVRPPGGEEDVFSVFSTSHTLIASARPGSAHAWDRRTHLLGSRPSSEICSAEKDCVPTGLVNNKELRKLTGRVVATREWRSKITDLRYSTVHVKKKKQKKNTLLAFTDGSNKSRPRINEFFQ